MTTISAVIPCYNQGVFVSQCITSILSQSSEVKEIIIVDDGSTQAETIATLKNLNFPKTRIITQNNNGLSAARNKGFREASGSWVLVIDADDYFAPDFIRQALQAVANDNTIGAVSSWVQMFGNRNDLWKCRGGSVKDFMIKNRCSSAGLVSRKLWSAVNGYDEQMPSYEDWDFWLRLTSEGYRVHVIPSPLFFYRKHAVSMLASHADRYFEIRRYIIAKNKAIYDLYYPEVILQLEEELAGQKLKNRELSSRSLLMKIIKRLSPWARRIRSHNSA